MSAATADSGLSRPSRIAAGLADSASQRTAGGSRVLMLLVQLALFALVVFVLVRAILGDPVLTLLGTQFTPALYARTEHALGLDGSLATQLGHYSGNLIRLTLGGSITSGRPVTTEFATRLPATLELALLAMAAVTVCPSPPPTSQ